MNPHVNIGATPCEEDCAQLGTEGYEEKAITECERFVELIRKTLGPEPKGARLVVKGFPHDYGVYYEVCCEFDPLSSKAEDYAYLCESSAPTTWRG